MTDLNPSLVLSTEVRDALDAGRPVLALESTIITHGMPWPRNLETARAAEAAVREAGAVPATVAVLDGRPTVGLTDPELEALAQGDGDMAKASRRDLPLLMARGGSAGTTVAATMILAHLAGIRVFATGGIGGVHRGAENSMDISADLQELARTPVAVVCAGPKSVLDIGLTLEYLETHGVPVIGFGTEELPAFYTRQCGFGVDARVDSATGVADVLRQQARLGYPGGTVIANPVPAEHALPQARVEAWVTDALGAAERAGVSGKAVTPFLLAHLEAMTGGDSLDTNVALMLGNARLGAEIAVALAKD